MACPSRSEIHDAAVAGDGLDSGQELFEEVAEVFGSIGRQSTGGCAVESELERMMVLSDDELLMGIGRPADPRAGS